MDFSFLYSKKFQMTFGVLFLLLIIYFSFMPDIKAIGKRKVLGQATDAVNGGNMDMGLLLKKGMRGTEVTALQNLLINNGHAMPKYGADGVFGTETENALKKATGKISVTLSEANEMIGGNDKNKLVEGGQVLKVKSLSTLRSTGTY